MANSFTSTATIRQLLEINRAKSAKGIKGLREEGKK
jgi:biotin operon repressor